MNGERESLNLDAVFWRSIPTRKTAPCAGKACGKHISLVNNYTPDENYGIRGSCVAVFHRRCVGPYAHTPPAEVVPAATWQCTFCAPAIAVSDKPRAFVRAASPKFVADVVAYVHGAFACDECYALLRMRPLLNS
jgi:hypothetical protein